MERAAWSIAIAPDEQELGRIERELGISGKLLGHALDPGEHPRVRSAGEFTFVLLRVPAEEPEGADVPFVTAPVGIVIGPNGGVVVASRDGVVVRALEELQRDAASGATPQRVILTALELTAKAYLAHLDALDARVDAAEKRLSRSLENREVLELLRYQKSLVYFSSALDGMHLLLERLPKAAGFRLDPADEDWLGDVTVEFRQALETSNLQRDVMSEMMDAFASIISNNLNVVMKFLAAVTVILTLPMVVASFYGMNVVLPGQAHPHAFAETVVLSLVLGVALAAYFRRRGWL